MTASWSAGGCGGGPEPPRLLEQRRCMLPFTAWAGPPQAPSDLHVQFKPCHWLVFRSTRLISARMCTYTCFSEHHRQNSSSLRPRGLHGADMQGHIHTHTHIYCDLFGILLVL